MDVFAPQERSRIMAKIKGRDTKPELLVRKALHFLGYRFRLHRKELPGKPDIVLPKYKTAVFVHGCFWHGHDCKKGAKPASNTEFWDKKLSRNIERDRKNIERLENSGWKCVTVWECETKDEDLLLKKLNKALRSISNSKRKTL